MNIAQITDTHITAVGERVYGRYDTAESLRAAIARLNGLRPRPDLVLVTGDLVHHGAEAEYAHFVALMTGLELPWQAIPGNHDDRGPFLRALGPRLPEDRLDGFGQFAVDAGPLRVLCLDTLRDGHHDGELCAARLDWLDGALAAAGSRPVVIAMHHPPFDTGILWMDLAGTDWAAPLAGLVRRFDAVQAILCGHVHRPIVRRWARTVAVACPSTAYQVGADLDRLDAHLCVEPAALHLCRWDGEALVHHFLPIEPDRAPHRLVERDVLLQLKAYADGHGGAIPKDINIRLRGLDAPGKAGPAGPVSRDH